MGRSGGVAEAAEPARTEVPVNAYRGETVLTLAGKAYVLRLTTNVLALLEDALGARGELLDTLRTAGFRTVRATLYTAITAPNRDGERQMPLSITIEAFGEMMDEAGGIAQKSPLTIAYWQLLVNAGFVDREEAVRLKLIPATPGKAEAGADPAAAPAEGAQTATAGT